MYFYQLARQYHKIKATPESTGVQYRKIDTPNKINDESFSFLQISAS